MTSSPRALALSLAICLAACGGGPDSATIDATGSTAPATTSVPPAATTPTVVATPSTASSGSPSDFSSDSPSDSSSGASPGVGGGAGAYFQALDDQSAVDGVAAPDSPAAAYGSYLANFRAASTALGFPPSLDATIEAVDAGFDLVDASNQRIEFRDVQVDGEGHVVSFSRNGTPIADSVWTAPTSPDGDLGAGDAFAFANDRAFFVVLDVSNGTDGALAMAGVTFSQGGRQVASDPAIDTYPGELAAGETRGMFFGTPGLADAERGPVTVTIEARRVDGAGEALATEVTLQPVS